MSYVPATYQFTISELFQKAFGREIEYDLVNSKADQQESSKYGSSPYRAEDAKGRWMFMPVTLDTLQLVYAVIRVTGRKNIVETQLTERKGSVIEIINQDSYKIYIRGFLIDHTGNYPEDGVNALKELFEQNKSVPIKSVLTDLFLTEEDRIVITELNFPEVTGIENIKPFEMNMVSDSIFDLEIE